MRVGVVVLPQFDAAETTARWKAVQDMGFAHGWTYDHLAWRDLADEPWYATMPTLTVAALATSTLRIGTWVTSPNFRHPVTLAKDLMTLDVLSGGRVIAGIGAGGLGWDSRVFGEPDLSPRARIDRLAEFVELTDLLLRQPVTTWHGDRYRAVDAHLVPGCVQQPRLPIVVAANGPRGMRIAARFGNGWATVGSPADDLAAWWRGVAELSERFTEISGTTEGRAEPDRYLDLDSAPVYSLSSPDAFDDAAGRAAELGFTDVVAHWPRRTKRYVGDPAVLEQVAARLGPGGTR
jgi:alkanesulfonate monooxygenase SsuD/methylene tetrahydromethanopterin reductase-like flavin-dependent oxidoreductase (luciferase family)